MRLLFIEDDSTIVSFVGQGLRQAGFTVAHAADGSSGLSLALTEPFDAAIVDIMLPVMDGLTVVQALRQRRVCLPVLILSARRALDERVRGLQIGADDYLTKPFAFTELLARIRALLRRGTAQPASTTLTVGELHIDLLARSVHRGDRRIDLQPREFSLLEYMARNAGWVLSKTMILERVWDLHFDPGTNVVESRVCRLRDKIDQPCDAPMIHTVRGVGYVLRPPA
jgi:two-component system, OmpR family, response regulator